MKNILITGVNGSGGSYLAEYVLTNTKNKIVGTYRGKKKNFQNLKKINLNKKFKLIKCTLNNINSVKSLLKKHKFDIIFHLASNANVLESFKKPREVILNNNICTLNLLEACRLLRINSRIVICSTSEVYGNVKKKNQPIIESNDMNPINPYAVSKCFQDLLAQNYCRLYNLDIVITRMFTYTNPKRANLFASAFAKQVVEIEKGTRKKLIHGNLNSYRTLIDIRDAMKSYWLAGEKGKKGEIYNIGGSNFISIKEFLKKLVKKSNRRVKLFKDKNLVRPADISIQIPSSIKFIKRTKWSQKYNIDQTIDYLINEARNIYS